MHFEQRVVVLEAWLVGSGRRPDLLRAVLFAAVLLLQEGQRIGHLYSSLEITLGATAEV